MSEWTPDTLKAYTDAIFREHQNALDKAAHDIELRDIKNNEFRGQLADQAARFPTRVEVENKLETLSAQIKAKNVQVVLAAALAVVATLIAVFNFAVTQAG